MTVQQQGQHVIFESKDDKHDGGYMLVRLKIDGPVASGSWHENAKQHGPFEGLEYSGAGQLIFDASKMEFKGVWAGAGLDRKTNEPKIYTGRWEIVKV